MISLHILELFKISMRNLKMEDSDDQDVPQRLLDMLRIFLAASKRGDNAALILEIRNKDIITKYRSVEPAAGVSATTNTQLPQMQPRER